MKKYISLFLITTMILTSFSVAFGEEQTSYDNNVVANDNVCYTDLARDYSGVFLTKEVLEANNYIIIDSEEKAKEVLNQDLKEIQKRWEETESNIPTSIINAFHDFCESPFIKTEANQKNNASISEKATLEDLKNTNRIIDNNYTNDMIVNDFYTYCSENGILINQGQAESKEQIVVLRVNAVEQLILSYFAINGYSISYGMFLHSLTSNPSNLYYSIEGVSAHQVTCGTMSLAPAFAYEFLCDSGFITMIYNFSRRGAWEENLDGFHYEFNNGDLALSIHGTTNMRLHRMPSTKTYFRIWDIYDFAGELAAFLIWTTNTNTYGTIVEGSYQWN